MARVAYNDSMRWIDIVHDRRGPEGDASGPARSRSPHGAGSTKRSKGRAHSDQADIIIATTQAKSAFDGDDLLAHRWTRVTTSRPVSSSTRSDRPREPSLRGVFGRPSRLALTASSEIKGLVPGRRHERWRQHPGKCVFGGYIFLLGLRPREAAPRGGAASAAPLFVLRARKSREP